MQNETEFNSVPALLRHFIKRDELSVKQLHLWAGSDDVCSERHIYNVVNAMSPVTLPMLLTWMGRMQSDMRLQVAQTAFRPAGLVVALNDAEKQPDLMGHAIRADDASNDLLTVIHAAMKDKHVCGQDSAIIDVAADLLIKTVEEIKASLPRPSGRMRYAGEVG
jgi:hypothetical protein